MQQPTCTNLRIRNSDDANRVLHAVMLRKLPIVTRRLGDEERLALRSGCVYVWEERSNNPLEVTGQEIQRFTEGRSWGPSRAREDFLLYFEKEGGGRTSIIHRNGGLSSQQMIKQTYSVFVEEPHTRKWHLNAYYTEDTRDSLMTVDEIPELRKLVVPEGMYISARACGQRRGTRTASRRYSVEDGSVSLQSQPHPTYVGQTAEPDPNATRTLFMEEGSGIRLAPLEFLEKIPPVPRNPIDDQVLRSFRDF